MPDSTPEIPNIPSTLLLLPEAFAPATTLTVEDSASAQAEGMDPVLLSIYKDVQPCAQRQLPGVWDGQIDQLINCIAQFCGRHNIETPGLDVLRKRLKVNSGWAEAQAKQTPMFFPEIKTHLEKVCCALAKDKISSNKKKKTLQQVFFGFLGECPPGVHSAIINTVQQLTKQQTVEDILAECRYQIVYCLAEESIMQRKIKGEMSVHLHLAFERYAKEKNWHLRGENTVDHAYDPYIESLPLSPADYVLLEKSFFDEYNVDVIIDTLSTTLFLTLKDAGVDLHNNGHPLPMMSYEEYKKKYEDLGNNLRTEFNLFQTFEETRISILHMSKDYTQCQFKSIKELKLDLLRMLEGKYFKSEILIEDSSCIVRIISCFSEFTYVQEDDRFSWYEDRLDLFDKLSSIVEDCPSKTRELHKRSLFLAFAKGDYSMLRKLFSYGVHCCYVDRKGDTILIKAVKAGNLEMVEFLFPYFQQSPTVPDINSLLKIAIQYQRKDMVCYFVVTRLANPNTVTEDGSTALMLAAEQGDLGFVTLFIGRGVNLNAKTASGWTALMFAAKTGNLDIVKYLAKQSADLSLESGYKETALTIAAKAGKKEVTEFLYQRTKARAKNTDFLLLLAIRQGWLDLAKVFAGNISLNRYCWHYGHLNAVINAFVEAATRENKEIVKFVLSEVYSSLAIQCALKACMLAGKKDMMIFLLNDCLETGDRGEVGVNVLIQAVIYNKKEMVVFLLKQGVDPHYGSTDDKTPLMTAAENGHIDLIRLFLDKGVDLSTQDNVKGMSALMYAALTGRTDSAKLLLDHENNLKKNRPIHQAVEYRDNFIDLTSVAPMDPGYPLTLVGSSISPPILSQVDKSGNNAFFIAVQNGALETVKLFLSYGININAANEQGYTPLMIAAKSEHLDIMKLLIEEQAEIDVKLNWGRGRGYFFEKAFLDKYHKFEGMLTVVRDGYTALMFAAQYGNLEGVKLLQEQGADIKARGEGHRTALLLAALHGHKEIVAFLLQKGVDIHERSIKNNTALLAANKNRYTEVVKFLLKQYAHLFINNPQNLQEAFAKTPQLMDELSAHRAEIFVYIRNIIDSSSTEEGQVMSLQKNKDDFFAVIRDRKHPFSLCLFPRSLCCTLFKTDSTATQQEIDDFVRSCSSPEVELQSMEVVASGAGNNLTIGH